MFFRGQCLIGILSDQRREQGRPIFLYGSPKVSKEPWRIYTPPAFVLRHNHRTRDGTTPQLEVTRWPRPQWTKGGRPITLGRPTGPRLSRVQKYPFLPIPSPSSTEEIRPCATGLTPARFARSGTAESILHHARARRFEASHDV